MSETTRDEVVNALVDYLFTNGNGDKAERLVLTAADGRDLGGWSRAALKAILEGKPKDIMRTGR